MLGPKLDIFTKEWLDVVFEGRNQEYGAYRLRKSADSDTSKALFIGVLLFVIVLSTPIILKYIQKDTTTDQVERIIETEVILSEPPPVDEAAPPPPPPVEPPPPRVDQVRMPPPVVVKAEEVRDEEPPTVEELKTADPGPKTIAGDPNAAIQIDVPVGEGPKDEEVTEADPDEIFNAVQVAPTPAGGLEGFYKFLGENYKYPAQARRQGVSGRVRVQFVVERDGSLPDIKVLRDLGLGTGEEAIRVLKNAPKWNPGIQNGKPVRVRFTLPIALNLK